MATQLLDPRQVTGLSAPPPESQRPPLKQPELLFHIEGLTEVPCQGQGRQGVRLQGQQAISQTFRQRTPSPSDRHQEARRSCGELPLLRGVAPVVAGGLQAGSAILSLQHLRDLGSAQGAEGDPLTAGADGVEQLVGGGGDEDQKGLSRFLQGLEQGIGGRFRHQLHPVHDHQATAPLNRPAGKKPADLANLLETDLRTGPAVHPFALGPGEGHELPLMLMGGLHPEKIGMVALLQATTQGRSGRGLLQHPLQKTQGRQSASHPLRACKQVSRRQALLRQGRFQQAHGRILSDQIAESTAQGTPPSWEMNSLRQASATASGGWLASMRCQPR